MNGHRTILAATAILLATHLAGCSSGAVSPPSPPTEQPITESPDASESDLSDTGDNGTEGDTSMPEPVEVSALASAAAASGAVFVQPMGSDCHVLTLDAGDVALLGTYPDSPGGANECYSARTYGPDFDVHVAWDDGVYVQRIGEPAEAVDNGLAMAFPAVGPDGFLYATASEPPAMAITGVLTRMTLDGEVVESLPQGPQSAAWVAGMLIDSDDLDAIAADPSGSLAVELLSTGGGTFEVGEMVEIRPGSEWRVSGDIAEITGPGAFEPQDWIDEGRFLSMDDAGTLYANVVDAAAPSVVVEEIAPLPAGYRPAGSRAIVCDSEAFVVALAQDDSETTVSVLLGVDLGSGSVTSYAAIPADDSTPGTTLEARVIGCAA